MRKILTIAILTLGGCASISPDIEYGKRFWGIGVPTIIQGMAAQDRQDRVIEQEHPVSNVPTLAPNSCVPQYNQYGSTGCF